MDIFETNPTEDYRNYLKVTEPKRGLLIERESSPKTFAAICFDRSKKLESVVQMLYSKHS